MAYRLEPEEVRGIAEALNARTTRELRELLHSVGERPAGRKADMVAALLPHYEGEGLRRLYDRLDEDGRVLVAEAVHGPSTELDFNLLLSKYGDLSSVNNSRDWYRPRCAPGVLDMFFYRSSIMPLELRDRLASAGFVEAPPGPEIESLKKIPEELQLVHKHWNSKLERQEADVVRIPITVRETENAARRDLVAVLRLVAAGEVKVSAKGRTPSPAVQQRVSEVIEGGDFYPVDGEDTGAIRGFAWPMLLQAAGLTNATGGKLTLTNAGKSALTAKPEKTLGRLWQRWKKSTLFDELRRVEEIRGQTGKGRHGLTALSGRRTAVEVGLKSCPPGAWVEVDEFFRYLQAADCAPVVSRNAWNLYFSELRYGSLGYEGHGTFEILEGRYIMVLLFEYAATLGLIDVAYVPPAGVRSDYLDAWGTDHLACLSRYDGLIAFRLNPLGAHVLGLESEYHPTPSKPRNDLSVLPTLEVVLSVEEPLPVDVLVLDRYGERQSERVWRLSREKLLRAISEGQSLSDLENFLRSGSAEPLPGPVVHLLTEATERGEAVTPVGPALLLECKDPALAALIANDRRTKKHCLPCGDHHLAIPLDSEKKFRKALEKLGYPLPPSGT